MKVKKIISVVASKKEMDLVYDFLALFDEMDTEAWDKLNAFSGYCLESALSTIQEIADKIACDDED